jgi:hypothetical protein
MNRKLDRLGGVVRSGAGDNRHPAIGNLDAQFDHTLVLGMVSVGDSPVVPTGTRPWLPALIIRSTWRANASSSTDPSSANGVMRAGIEPLNMLVSKYCTSRPRAL